MYSRHNFISGGMQNEPCTQTGRELPFSVNNQTGRKFSFSARKFRQSAQELKQVRTLTGVAMLLAMSVVISFTASVRVTETIKIGLGYLITALLGMLYGPFTAALAAGAGDLIKYLLKPDGAYFFGFTLTAMLGGVVYGVFFTEKNVPSLVPLLPKQLSAFCSTVCSIQYGFPGCMECHSLAHWDRVLLKI